MGIKKLVKELADALRKHIWFEASFVEEGGILRLLHWWDREGSDVDLPVAELMAKKALARGCSRCGAKPAKYVVVADTYTYAWCERCGRRHFSHENREGSGRRSGGVAQVDATAGSRKRPKKGDQNG